MSSLKPAPKGVIMRLPCTLALLLFLSLVSPAQQPGRSPEGEDIRKIVDQYMQPYLQKNRIQGAIVGVSIHGHRYFFPYGVANNANMPFTRDTLVEIGSCTKVFTTTLFALAINRDQMSPSVSAQTYMPKGYTLQPNAQQATPLMLADFSSGMPDDPTNLPPQLERRSIEYYTVKDFLSWVSGWNPPTPPPAPYLYSNAGIGTLSFLMSTATNKPWEEQLKSEIVGPLGMTDTELRPSPEQKRRLAQGHHPNGSVAPGWPIFAWFAAGGLRSTALDMLRFGEANLGHTEIDGKPVSPELIAAMKLAQTPIYTMPNGFDKQAMAWVNNMGNPNMGTKPEILKNGGTVGFGTVILLNPGKDMTLFIAVNKNGDNPAPIGVTIGRHLP